MFIYVWNHFHVLCSSTIMYCLSCGWWGSGEASPNTPKWHIDYYSYLRNSWGTKDTLSRLSVPRERYPSWARSRETSLLPETGNAGPRSLCKQTASFLHKLEPKPKFLCLVSFSPTYCFFVWKVLISLLWELLRSHIHETSRHIKCFVSC